MPIKITQEEIEKAKLIEQRAKVSKSAAQATSFLDSTLSGTRPAPGAAAQLRGFIEGRTPGYALMGMGTAPSVRANVQAINDARRLGTLPRPDRSVRPDPARLQVANENLASNAAARAANPTQSPDLDAARAARAARRGANEAERLARKSEIDRLGGGSDGVRDARRLKESRRRIANGQAPLPGTERLLDAEESVAAAKAEGAVDLRGVDREQLDLNEFADGQKVLVDDGDGGFRVEEFDAGSGQFVDEEGKAAATLQSSIETLNRVSQLDPQTRNAYQKLIRERSVAEASQDLRGFERIAAFKSIDDEMNRLAESAGRFYPEQPEQDIQSRFGARTFTDAGGNLIQEDDNGKFSVLIKADKESSGGGGANEPKTGAEALKEFNALWAAAVTHVANAHPKLDPDSPEFRNMVKRTVDMANAGDNAVNLPTTDEVLGSMNVDPEKNGPDNPPPAPAGDGTIMSPNSVLATGGELLEHFEPVSVPGSPVIYFPKHGGRYHDGELLGMDDAGEPYIVQTDTGLQAGLLPEDATDVQWRPIELDRATEYGFEPKFTNDRRSRSTISQLFQRREGGGSRTGGSVGFTGTSGNPRP